MPEHLSASPGPEHLRKVAHLIGDYQRYVAKAEKALRQAFDLDFMYAQALLRSAAPAEPLPDREANQTPYPVWSPHHPSHVPLTAEQAVKPYDHANPDDSGLIGMDPLLAEYYGVRDLLDQVRQGKAVLKKALEAKAQTVVQVARGLGPQPWKEVR